MILVKTMLFIDGVLMTTFTELPDTSTRYWTKMNKKGHKNEFFGENMTSGNSEVAFFIEMPRTLGENCPMLKTITHSMPTLLAIRWML